MFTNYLTTALRAIRRNTLYTFINVFGLAVGMACCIVIMLFVRQETQYDKHHTHADRLYRMTREFLDKDGSVNLHLSTIAPPIAPLLRTDFPELKQVCRFTQDGSQTLLKYGNKTFLETKFVWAEPNIFDVLTIPFVKGNPQTALAEPNSVVLTEETSRRYFGEEEAIGKTILFDTTALKVTGVVRDLPVTTHFHFDFLCSFITLKQFAPGEFEPDNWSSNNYGTYIVLPENMSAEQIESRFPAFLDKHIHPPPNSPAANVKAHEWTRVRLQKVTDIHLHSHLDYELEENGDIRYVWIFSAVAALVLFIACVNFTNLSTARSQERAKEVGVRKAMGAHRAQVMTQFLSESVILALVSLLAAILLTWLAMPLLNNFTNLKLSLWSSDVGFTVLGLFVIALLVGVVAGSYPAFVLSAFDPVKILRGLGATRTKAFLRRALVIGQFAIAVMLLISMGVVLRQVEYCRTVDLGFTKDYIVTLRGDRAMSERIERIKSELLQNTNIVAIGASRRVPSGRLLDSQGWRIEKDGAMQSLDFRIANVPIDYTFIPTYGMTMAAGRNFSKDFATDTTEAFILNESAVRAIGWTAAEEAIGKGFEHGDRKGKIVGVVKDFHFESMREKISPLVFLVGKSSLRTISLKIRPENIPATLDFLRSKWKIYRPEFEFDYEFLDARFDKLYKSEEKLGQLFGIFAGIAVFVGCLGLFGLAAFTAERRTKEIGIRKVMGASVLNIVALLSKDFLLLVSIAFLLACPLAYWAMRKWLQTFAYATTIGVDVLLLSGAVAVFAAFAAILWQTLKAARSNPVNALKYE
ncbi:MAG: ABC transporter permease [Candidatus Kapabacteria bacterium]|jgi:putative ABC transport system permease protein|nr:ABC transporter permease [Candidatus Kapabacteria bacterium]